MQVHCAVLDSAGAALCVAYVWCTWVVRWRRAAKVRMAQPAFLHSRRLPPHRPALALALGLALVLVLVLVLVLAVAAARASGHRQALLHLSAR